MVSHGFKLTCIFKPTAFVNKITLPCCSMPAPQSTPLFSCHSLCWWGVYEKAAHNVEVHCARPQQLNCMYFSPYLQALPVLWLSYENIWGPTLPSQHRWLPLPQTFPSDVELCRPRGPSTLPVWGSEIRLPSQP